MSTLPEFLYAIALTAIIAFGGHYYWASQSGGNFNPTAQLDPSQVIDATDIHELFGI